MDKLKESSKGEQTRQTILAGALGLVSEVGYEGPSIGVLAEKRCSIAAAAAALRPSGLTY